MVFSFQAGDTIDIDTSDELSAFLTDIGGALDLDDQDVTVDSTVGVSVDNAKTIAAETEGNVTATIASGTRVASLTELRTPDGENEEAHSWTITISDADATLATAADLNTINDATTEQVISAEVTALAASDIADLDTLHSGIAGFSTLANITAVTLTDNGGGDGSVDFGTLKDLSLIHI